MFLSSDFQLFGFGMVGYSNSYSYGPDHSKTKPLEIRKKWRPFCSDFQWFWTNWPPFCSDFQWFQAKWPPFCSKWNTIGKPITNGKPNRRLPLEFRTCSVFQPPLQQFGICIVETNRKHEFSFKFTLTMRKLDPHKPEKSENKMFWMSSYQVILTWPTF